MVDMTKTTTEKKLTPGDIRGVFIRSNLFQGSWNFERMQALGFCFSMVPAIKRLYPENNEARRQAIKRHLEFFNTHPYVAAPVLGVTLAMEEQRANGAEIDDGAINGIKVGLMGPLAGVGDPIFWGTLSTAEVPSVNCGTVCADCATAPDAPKTRAQRHSIRSAARPAGAKAPAGAGARSSGRICVAASRRDGKDGKGAPHPVRRYIPELMVNRAVKWCPNTPRGYTMGW